MDTFNPPVMPDYDGNQISETPRVLNVQFGDGYAQTAPDGLNSNDATAQYKWSSLTLDEYTAIIQFYLAHMSKPFYWNAPGDIGGNNKWIFSAGPVKSVASFDRYSITISLKRSFALA